MTRRRGIAVLVAAALVVTGAAGCGGGGGGTSKDVVHTTTTRVEVLKGIGGPGGFDPHAIYQQESPGVVTVISVFGGGGDNPLGGGGAGQGSGFVLNGNGEIATNAHVVTTQQGSKLQEAGQVYVAFADGNRVAAKIRGYDPNADVALLQIDPSGLRLNPLPLGSSANVQVGEPVAAMGSPFGEQQSLSVGVVSAVDRNVSSLTNFDISNAIQTDAAINPGNSGGPLVDAHGRVIGLNQQIQTRSGGGEGVGFAVPIDLARRSIAQLRDKGHVDYAYLGVSSQAVYPQLAEHFNLPVQRGAWLQQVNPGGPAARAGLRGGSSTEHRFQAASFRTGGDIVVKAGDREVHNPNDLGDAIATRAPGDTIALVIRRGSAERTVRVTLGTRPTQITGP